MLIGKLEGPRRWATVVRGRQACHPKKEQGCVPWKNEGSEVPRNLREACDKEERIQLLWLQMEDKKG